MATQKKSIWKNKYFKGGIVGLLVVVLLTGIVMPVVFYTNRNSKRMPELSGYDPDYEPEYYRVTHDDAAAGVLKAASLMSGLSFPNFAEQDSQRVRIPFESVSVESAVTAKAVTDEGENPDGKDVMIVQCLTYSKEGDKSVSASLYVLAVDGVSVFSLSVDEVSASFSSSARIKGYEARAAEASYTVTYENGSPVKLTAGADEYALTDLETHGSRKTYSIFQVVDRPEYTFSCCIKDIYIPVQEGGYYSITYFEDRVWRENSQFMAVLRFECEGENGYVVISLLSTEYRCRSGDGAESALRMNDLRIGDTAEITVYTTEAEFARTLYTAAKVVVLES